MTVELHEVAYIAPQKIGVLITNLGTPDAATPSAVRRYLKEFLWDPRVVAIPRFIWWLILHLLILPFRSKKSATLYQRIWTEQGSPLKFLSEQLVTAIQAQLEQQFPNQYQVILGMRYGNPSVSAALTTLQAANIKQLIVLPLYPQYSATTVASTFAAVFRVLNTWRYIPALQMINTYAVHPLYIEAIAASIQNYWRSNGRGQKLLFSFHGIPKQCVVAGDPYYFQCQQSAQLIAEQLALTTDEWMVVYQSRFGKAKWLTPYCDLTLQALAKQGINNIDIICPGFAVDCLETLEEIALQNKALFIEAGGEKLNYIPALNISDGHVKLLTCLIENQL